MGYILPIHNYQSYQYMMRSLSTKERFSYIHHVQNAKKHDQFGRDLEQRNKQAVVKYWSEMKWIKPQTERKKQLLNTSPHNTLDDDLNRSIFTGKGFYFDVYA